MNFLHQLQGLIKIWSLYILHLFDKNNDFIKHL